MSELSEEDFQKLVEEYKPLDYTELLKLLEELDKFTKWMKEIPIEPLVETDLPASRQWISIKDRSS